MKFKVGDKVEIINKRLSRYGDWGYITEVDPADWCKVTFPDKKDCIIYNEDYNLKLFEEDATIKEKEKTYEDGLEDAWEYARKFIQIKYEEAHEVYDARIILKYSPHEAIKKIKEYEEEMIKVGDEIICKESHGIVTKVAEIDYKTVKTYYVMLHDGSTGYYTKEELTKTGRHFPQIAEMLKQLKEEKNDTFS